MNKRLLAADEVGQYILMGDELDEEKDTKELLEAQDAKTLKKVGEWLGKGRVMPDVLGAVRLLIANDEYKALRQGRMPE